MLVSDVDDANIMEECASEMMVDVRAKQHGHEKPEVKEKKYNGL